MKLCDTYSEIVIDDDRRNFIKVVGNSSCTKVHLILNNGVNIDPKDKIGISHVCEHIFIEYVAEKYNEKTRDENYFQSMGYTNYEHTVLSFYISSKQENVECLINIITELISNLCVKSEYVQKCKMDVIKECNVKKKESEYSLKVNSFITDENINYLPIGDVDKIINLEEEDITTFLPKYYSSFSFVIIHNKNISTDIFKNLITKKTISQNSTRKSCCQNTQKNIGKVLNVNSEYQKNLKIYFKQTKVNYTYKEKVAKCLIEIIINYKICSFLCIDNEQYSPITFKRKIVNKDYSFIVVCLDGYEKNLKGISDNLAEYLLDIFISNKDFNQSMKTFISFLNETTDIDDTYVFNSIFHYLVYEDVLSITDKHVNQLRKMIKKITLDDIIKLKKEIFTSDYKVVTGY